jgi:hypothetical protein
LIPIAVAVPLQSTPRVQQSNEQLRPPTPTWPACRRLKHTKRLGSIKSDLMRSFGAAKYHDPYSSTAPIDESNAQLHLGTPVLRSSLSLEEKALDQRKAQWGALFDAAFEKGELRPSLSHRAATASSSGCCTDTTTTWSSPTKSLIPIMTPLNRERRCAWEVCARAEQRRGRVVPPLPEPNHPCRQHRGGGFRAGKVQRPF